MPPGTVDPIFLHELALELHMTVGELTHGRGAPMSAHELSVAWPAFYATQRRIAAREAESQNRQARRRRR